MTGISSVRPGDFAVIDTRSDLGAMIRFAEMIADRGHVTRWSHAVIASRWCRGDLMIVEARPGGAVEVPWHYDGMEHLWSTGILPSCPLAGEYARSYIRTPYSYLDYEAIAAHSLHIPLPGLREFIADSHHMICSQLVDQARLDGGSHLFDDGRWPGYVKPSDLGRLLGA